MRPNQLCNRGAAPCTGPGTVSSNTDGRRCSEPAASLLTKLDAVESSEGTSMRKATENTATRAMCGLAGRSTLLPPKPLADQVILGKFLALCTETDSRCALYPGQDANRMRTLQFALHWIQSPVWPQESRDLSRCLNDDPVTHCQ